MPYLTNEEYIARFGEAETKRLTDEARTGDVDSAKLEEALSDSEDEVNMFLGKRYTIPLASPPALVKGYVGDLARERLFKTTPHVAVKEAAERARSQLRDLARGLAILPSEVGAVPEDARAPANSASSNDASTPIFTEENLAGFGVPSGYGMANWRR